MKIILPSLAKNLGRIYFTLPFVKSLKIGETVNLYVQDQGDIDIGTVVEILILNRLCGFKTPLYKIAQWAQAHAIGEIYGIDAKKLTDDRLGDVLDKIFLHIDVLDCQLTINLVKSYDLDISQIHFDPSSFKVTGKPCARAGDPKSIDITYGRNGKGRINERQVRFGLATAAQGNVALLGKAYSGNTTDYEMHPEFLKQLRKIVDKSDFLIVSDSKFDSEDNIINILDHDGTFVCPGVLRETWQEEIGDLLENCEIEWQDINYVALADKKKGKKKRPYYKAFETMEEIKKEVEGETKYYYYRVIVVYSSEKAKLQKKTRQKRIRYIRHRLQKIRASLNKGEYISASYIEKQIAKALASNDKGKIFQYKLVEHDGLFFLDYWIDDLQLKKMETLDGIYLLKTNLDQEQYPIDKVFNIYKQQGQIEHRIKVIKGPLNVAPIFLKDPKRIAALFFVIVQALKVYSIIEWQTRKAIEEQNLPLPILPEGRKTTKPTGETILRVFDHSPLILIYEDAHGNKIRKLTKPNDIQIMIFRLLDLKIPDLRTLTRKFGKFRKLRKRGDP